MYFRRCLNLNDTLVRQFSLNFHRHQKTINHYDCLGITPKASQGDVKTAYYKLSKKYHPDLNKGNLSAASKFRDITSAYEVLGNVKARKLYDRSLSVRGIEDFSQAEDAESDDYSHAPFYHARNKPFEKKPIKKEVKSTHYNVDEWTKAHYTKTFQRAKTMRYEVETEIKNDKADDEHYALLLKISFGLGIVFFFLITTSNMDFDVPSNVKSKKGE